MMHSYTMRTYTLGVKERTSKTDCGRSEAERFQNIYGFVISRLTSDMKFNKLTCPPADTTVDVH